MSRECRQRVFLSLALYKVGGSRIQSAAQKGTAGRHCSLSSPETLTMDGHWTKPTKTGEQGNMQTKESESGGESADTGMTSTIMAQINSSLAVVLESHFSKFKEKLNDKLDPGNSQMNQQ